MVRKAISIGSFNAGELYLVFDYLAEIHLFAKGLPASNIIFFDGSRNVETICLLVLNRVNKQRSRQGEGIVIDEILTERLILRTVEESDFDDVCEYGIDEETGKYMIYWPKIKEEIRTFILDCKEAVNCDNPSWIEFVMQLKSSSKVIGNISLQIDKGIAEIGWISNKKYWNSGYMSEAVKAIIYFAFKNLAIEKIVATCSDQNIASSKVMEKCGMKRIYEDKNCKSIKNGMEVIYTKLTYCIYS